jgi:hypothetical protein
MRISRQILGETRRSAAMPRKWLVPIGLVAIAVAVLVASCADPKPADSISTLRLTGAVNGQIVLQSSGLACGLFYDRGNYATGPDIPTFSMSTRGFLPINGDPQKTLTLSLLLEGPKSGQTYDLSSSTAYSRGITFDVYSNGANIAFDDWRMSGGTITISSASNAFQKGTASEVRGRVDGTFTGVLRKQFHMTGSWECTVPATTNGEIHAHK